MKTNRAKMGVSTDRAKMVVSYVSHACAVAVVLLVVPLSIPAQAGVGTATVGPRVDPEAARIRDEQQREMQLRNLEGSAAHSNEKVVKFALDQLNQDFKRIQILRNEIAHALKADRPLDYKRVSVQTAEVNKRALRMQTYLALRVADAQARNGAAQIEYNDQQMKDALVKMCKRIDSFVANPKFTSPLVFDVKGTASASRDLQEIIALSGGIKENAERLNLKHR